MMNLILNLTSLNLSVCPSTQPSPLFKQSNFSTLLFTLHGHNTTRKSVHLRNLSANSKRNTRHRKRQIARWGGEWPGRCVRARLCARSVAICSSSLLLQVSISLSSLAFGGTKVPDASKGQTRWFIGPLLGGRLWTRDACRAPGSQPTSLTPTTCCQQMKSSFHLFRPYFTFYMYHVN